MIERLMAAACVAALMSIPAAAQDALAPAPAPADAARRVFVEADFARFAPKTAYDMLLQLPGFTIRAASAERGLGQASENILVDGERVADKSGGAVARLQRTPASSVERIELTDAAQLGIAGLSGQVANVVLRQGSAASGQYEWRPEFRPHYAHPNLYRGSFSYSDRAGPVEYTLSVDNQGNRGAYGGPFVRITDGAGAEIERRDLRLHSDFDQPNFTARFKIDGPDDSVANLSVKYGPYWYSYGNQEYRTRPNGDDRVRGTTQTQQGYMFDVNGDYAFGLGPGRLKLIAVRHFEHEPTFTTQRTVYASGAPADGTLFNRDARIGETILRGEYGWKGGSNSWQISLEQAVNRLEQVGRLYSLSPADAYVEVPYPEGSGAVLEHRYEGVASLSRPLSSALDLQLVGGGEISKLERLDGNLAPRKFFRPKGSASLAWRPSAGWDTSLKLSRSVGQISFYDFLAQPNLTQDRTNAGNPDLVPPQSWELEGEVGRALGAWGKTRIKLYAHRIDDIIDIVPIGVDGESVGNLPRASRFGVESTSTIQFDPLGWRGAKLDAKFGFVQTSVRDPLTGEQRPISGEDDYYGSLSLRHDIPNSQIAWGGSASLNHVSKTYFLTEVGRGWEGPVFANLYVEHKDLLGLTVRATAGNILGARHKFDRTVYNGYRDRSSIAFVEHQDTAIGPIFTLSLKGRL